MSSSLVMNDRSDLHIAPMKKQRADLLLTSLKQALLKKL